MGGVYIGMHLDEVLFFPVIINDVDGTIGFIDEFIGWYGFSYDHEYSPVFYKALCSVEFLSDL